MVDSPFTAQFGILVSETLLKWHVPGLSIAIVSASSTHARGFGFATLPSQPVTPETLFYTGSTTKAFTSAALSLLIDDDPSIDWSTPIHTLIPADFVLADPYWTTHLTVEDVLCHRTGFPRHDLSLGGKGTTTRAVVRSLRHLPMTAEPRTTFQYNNIMYIAASHVIEAVTRKPLRDVFRERIWAPLGMRDTFLSLREARESELPLARGYCWDAEKEVQQETEWMDMPWGSGAGCVISNVLDYAKWIRCMIDGKGPMSKEGHERLTRPIMPFESGLPAYMPARFYALGWRVTWYRGEKVVWHTGGIRGFGAVVLFLPGRAWGCAMLGNAEDKANSAQERLVWYLVDELLGVPERERFDWDGKNEEKVVRKEKEFKNARARLYPDVVSVQHSLPIQAYTAYTRTQRTMPSSSF